MSKKTKKQKILADRRRQNQKILDIPYEARLDTGKVSASAQQFRIDPNQTQSIYSYPVHLIKKDLTKMILVCILAISLEIALFLVFEKHLILPFGIKP